MVVLAGLATTALPVLSAEAKPGHDKPAVKHDGKSKRCKKARSVGFVVRGSLESYEDASVTLAVQRANRHARRWLEAGNAPVFDTTGLRVKFAGVTDANADSVVDLADVLPTDRVKVLGKLAVPKAGCEGEVALKLKKLRVSRNAAEEKNDD